MLSRSRPVNIGGRVFMIINAVLHIGVLLGINIYGAAVSVIGQALSSRHFSEIKSGGVVHLAGESIVRLKIIHQIHGVNLVFLLIQLSENLQTVPGNRLVYHQLPHLHLLVKIVVEHLQVPQFLPGNRTVLLVGLPENPGKNLIRYLIDLKKRVRIFRCLPLCQHRAGGYPGRIRHFFFCLFFCFFFCRLLLQQENLLLQAADLFPGKIETSTGKYPVKNFAGRAGAIIHRCTRPIKNDQFNDSRTIQQNSPLLYIAVICCYLLFMIAL